MSTGRTRAQLACGFLLHQRPYRDSSLILELFVRDHGRLSAFAHGARGPRSRFAVLQPFRPLLLSWSGRGESPTLSAAEDALAPPPPFPPERILSAFYLNELLLKLTVPHDPQPELYAHYATTLARLRALEPLDAVLRHFEKHLLDLLGYGNDLRCEAGGRAVAADAYYHFRPGAGLWPAVAGEVGGKGGGTGTDTGAGAGLVQGRVLLALAADEALADAEGRRQARLVLRAALDHCLDGRELRARTVAHAVARMERSA
jgi:DNA repair protein RecO (recombination protein O)